MSATNKRQRDRSPAVYLVAALLAAIAGFGTVYLIFAPSDNGRVAESSAPPPGSAGQDEEVVKGPLVGLNKGAMAPLLIRPKPLDLPELSFAGADGETKTLAGYKGKIVLLNIWASWCVPCREEMPQLDKLQAEIGGKDFEVVAVNIDRGGGDKAKKFLEETGATHLSPYTDPSGKLFAAVKAVGMPTTLLIDRDGREIGRLVGPADWGSEDAKRLIEAAIAAPDDAS
ncbi:MAG: TlpA family protein disulfide reductase [Methyloceanibacter sp.]|jgi:thiol-disulfide isomerase/thioredoxin|nr:TlpA family protein disulfide reductase [Methyloceanibacter sp.]